MDGCFANHPEFARSNIHQSCKGFRAHIECPRITAKGWHDQTSAIADKTFGVNPVMALDDGGTGMQMA